MTQSPESPPRYYTVHEANELLPDVRKWLRRLRLALDGLRTIQKRLAADDESVPTPEPDTLVDGDHFKTVVLFHDGLDNFRKRSIEVKDVDRGLIDFPAVDGDEEIRLCWLDGEASVSHYHDLETGFSGRKPIDGLSPEVRGLVDPDEDE